MQREGQTHFLPTGKGSESLSSELFWIQPTTSPCVRWTWLFPLRDLGLRGQAHGCCLQSPVCNNLSSTSDPGALGLLPWNCDQPTCSCARMVKSQPLHRSQNSKHSSLYLSRIKTAWARPSWVSSQAQWVYTVYIKNISSLDKSGASALCSDCSTILKAVFPKEFHIKCFELYISSFLKQNITKTKQRTLQWPACFPFTFKNKTCSIQLKLQPLNISGWFVISLFSDPSCALTSFNKPFKYSFSFLCLGER